MLFTEIELTCALALCGAPTPCSVTSFCAPPWVESHMRRCCTGARKSCTGAHRSCTSAHKPCTSPHKPCTGLCKACTGLRRVCTSPHKGCTSSHKRPLSMCVEGMGWLAVHLHMRVCTAYLDLAGHPHTPLWSGAAGAFWMGWCVGLWGWYLCPSLHFAKTLGKMPPPSLKMRSPPENANSPPDTTM